MAATVVLDLGSRVRKAYLEYLAVHQQIFHREIVRSLSFKQADCTLADTLSRLRAELRDALIASDRLASDSGLPVEVAYLAELRSFASAIEDAVTRLLVLCDVFAERDPRAAEIARYRISVERHVARELLFTQAEARLLEHVGEQPVSPRRAR